MFSAPSDPRESPVSMPRSRGVQRSPSRTCRTLPGWGQGHFDSPVLMPGGEERTTASRGALTAKRSGPKDSPKE
ncbi:hypothetical protein EYF80_050398 [Liparis tanakae]|uniref:Uncharacterized protein n=1 Tax=Liparis tanakae TaxID=230148 RepID=A0A4Z2FFC1_9TELE|nr:hypothetical protein EYF80_050398 [Liparis tanakae]